MTALSELRRQNKRIAVTSMCVGTVSLNSPLSYHELLLTKRREWEWLEFLFPSTSNLSVNIYKAKCITHLMMRCSPHVSWLVEAKSSEQPPYFRL